MAIAGVCSLNPRRCYPQLLPYWQWRYNMPKLCRWGFCCPTDNARLGLIGQGAGRKGDRHWPFWARAQGARER